MFKSVQVKLQLSFSCFLVFKSSVIHLLGKNVLAHLVTSHTSIEIPSPGFLSAVSSVTRQFMIICKLELLANSNAIALLHLHFMQIFPYIWVKIFDIICNECLISVVWYNSTVISIKIYQECLISTLMHFGVYSSLSNFFYVKSLYLPGISDSGTVQHIINNNILFIIYIIVRNFQVQ